MEFMFFRIFLWLTLNVTNKFKSNSECWNGITHVRDMSGTKRVVKKVRYRNPLSEEDSDVSYDKGDYESCDETSKKEEEEEEEEPKHTLEELGLKPFPECIISRQEWGAVKKKTKGRVLKHPTPNVVFTYKTGVPRCNTPDECVRAIQQLQRTHMAEGMADIAFNFLIGEDYRVYEGRGWDFQPEPKFQFPELRGKRLDIGFLGDYSGEEINIAMAGLGIDLAHYAVGQNILEKRYRLIETEMFIGFGDYEPRKKEPFPEYAFRIEDWYPGNPIVKEPPRSLFEEIGDKENIWDDYNG